MKILFSIASFLLLHFVIYGQKNVPLKNSFHFGPELSVTTGFSRYTYSLGGSFIYNDKHLFGSGITAVLPENPFKEKWNKGAYFEYNYFFGKVNSRRLTLYFTSLIQYLNISTYDERRWNYGTIIFEEKRNGVFNLIGLGANLKLANKLYMKTCVSVYSFGYFTYYSSAKYDNGVISSLIKYNFFDFMSFENFPFGYFNFRCSLSYLIK